MNDKDLITAIRLELVRELPGQGYAGAQILQDYQPDNEGRVTGPVVYIHKISDPRYGWQSRVESKNPISGEVTRTESQWMRSGYQFTCLAPSYPADLANICAMLMNSRSVIQSLMAKGVGIERITDIRTPYFKNDRDQFEQTPSFDVIFTHQRTITTRSGEAVGFTAETYPII